MHCFFVLFIGSFDLVDVVWEFESPARVVSFHRVGVIEDLVVVDYGLHDGVALVK